MKKNIVIIGSGLAGTLICNELADKCKVTLLEIGKKDRIGYPKITFVNKPLAVVKTFCIGGGGTTNLWHNGLMPMHAIDLTSSEFSAILRDAEQYIDQAARNLYWTGCPYEVIYKNIVSKMSSIAEDIGVFSDGIDCLLYPKKFNKLAPRGRIDARYSVSNINFVPDGKSIKSVNFCVDDTQYNVDADTIIISAGALGSPLLVKRVLSAIDCSNLGTGFMDHPIGFVGKIRFKKHVDNLIKRFVLFDGGAYECRTAVRLKSACGKYTCAAFFRPAITMVNNLSIYKYKSLLGASNGMDRIKNMFSFKIFHPDILAEIISHLFSLTIPGSTYNVFLLFEQKQGKSKITYNENRLVLDWRISDEEIRLYNNVLKKLKFMLSEIAEEVNIKTDIDEGWLWSAAHHSGTISLGENTNSYVDQDFRLHSCNNVFVCDGSIIQEHSYTNTGLTIGQLAMRLAERVSR